MDFNLSESNRILPSKIIPLAIKLVILSLVLFSHGSGCSRPSSSFLSRQTAKEDFCTFCIVICLLLLMEASPVVQLNPTIMCQLLFGIKLSSLFVNQLLRDNGALLCFQYLFLA